MPAIKSKKSQKGPPKIKVTVSNKVKDYSHDPYFVKKAKAAEAFLKTHGLPKELTRKFKEVH